MPDEDRGKADINKSLSKHAYSDALEAISRIACFTTSRNLKVLGRGEYYTIGQELLKKDLLILAISVRRLAELTQSQDILKNKAVNIRARHRAKNQEKAESCWNLIGNIVHGVDVTIFKDVGYMKLRAEILDFDTYYHTTDECDAALSITSDKHGSKTLKLTDFLVQINSYVEEANEILSDNGIYIGSGWEN